MYNTQYLEIASQARVKLNLFICIIRQQRANASKVTASAVFSVKFIVRDQWLAVAAGDAYGSVHIINVNAACSKMNKVRTFEAHPHISVDSLAVHPTDPLLLSSSREDTRIKLWNWDQGWVCTRIFEGRTWGVRHLAFNPMDINSFASVDKYGSQQVGLYVYFAQLLLNFLCFEETGGAKAPT